MISVDKALNIILKRLRLVSRERVSFQESLGRVLAKDIKATINLPPFSRSSVDGFAVRSIDVKKVLAEKSAEFKIVGRIQAGSHPLKCLRKFETMKIMTGAMIPAGADAVIMKEYAQELDGQVKFLRVVRSGENIRFKGEDTKKGATVLKKGNLVTSGVVSLLAALGTKKIAIYRKPKVAVLVTGNELLSIGRRLTPGKIYSANEFGLFGQIKEAGGKPVLLGVAADRLSVLRKKILQGFKYDCFIISGGVSVGDFDFVPRILKKLSVKIHFHGVSVQPGKPLLFGQKGKTYVFGLPGNPVSTAMTFYKFVRPLLLKIGGQDNILLKSSMAILAEDVKMQARRSKIFRAESFWKNNDLFVRLASHQGSGNVVSLAKATAIFEVPEDVSFLKKGTRLRIFYLP
ncbi:MAG: gephyrin-like molybdotransferase Glp [Candidatus Omnitrophota bacterium]